MSQEHVELARQAFDAFNRRDLGAYLALMDADVEAGSLLVALEGDYRGHAGIRRWWSSLHAVVPDYTGEVVEVRDLGDLTLVRLRTRGHGADSDTPFETPLWWIARWRRGRCVWWRSCGTEAEAVEAAGLWE
jgi:ketosteroid isomerase-like protein